MDLPIRFCDTERIAADTYLVGQLYGEGRGSVATYVNSMVITGSEPVIVDCDPAITGAGWLERTFEIVEPDDVRWVYRSHDDVDHTGNVMAAWGPPTTCSVNCPRQADLEALHQVLATAA